MEPINWYISTIFTVVGCAVLFIGLHILSNDGRRREKAMSTGGLVPPISKPAVAMVVGGLALIYAGSYTAIQ